MAETIGQQLKQAREGKNLTIQQVVQVTQIRAHHLEAIEADDFESLPSPIQARGFLRLYAEFLGLSLEDVISNQREGVGLPASTGELSSSFDQVTVSSDNSGNNPLQGINQVSIGFPNKVIARFNRIAQRVKTKPGPVGSTELTKPEIPHEPEKVEKDSPQAEAPFPIIDTLPSQNIFTTIGETLRQRREGLSLTFDEIERHTHVRKHYLLALEAGNFVDLPSSVQARGMLNNYAHLLNLDVDAILLTFADGLQHQLLERQAKSEEKSDKHSSKFPFLKDLPFKIKIPAVIRRYISLDVIVGGGLIILLLAFAIWGTSRIISLRTGSTPQPTAPPILSLLQLSTELPTSTPEPETTGNGPTPAIDVAVQTAALTLPAAGQGAVQIVVIAQNSAFVRVTVDGKVQFEGRVTAGNAYPYDGNIQIEVLTGNGRAISILYNQNNLGPMGDIGQVVDHIYTANAILNPTATFTPTTTITPTPTNTLRPTATLRPSVTPRSSPTPRPSQTSVP
jgi:cytoskeletal protein RodZ